MSVASIQRITVEGDTLAVVDTAIVNGEKVNYVAGEGEGVVAGRTTLELVASAYALGKHRQTAVFPDNCITSLPGAPGPNEWWHDLHEPGPSGMKRLEDETPEPRRAPEAPRE